MSSFVIQSSTTTSAQGPKLKRGRVKIYASTTVYWVIGENPQAVKGSCAVLRAGETVELKLPVNCSRLAVLAATEPGYVTITEVAGARASCS